MLSSTGYYESSKRGNQADKENKMFAVTFNNGNNSGFTDGELIADGSIFVVTIWNDGKNPTRCIFVNASNVFPV